MTNSDHTVETYKSLISISIEGFKFLALANGGSAVALLAYLGNIACKNQPAPDIRYAMIALISGLIFCGLYLLFVYLTQLKLFQESKDNVHSSKYDHRKFLVITITTYLLSLAFFVLILIEQLIAFIKLKFAKK